MNTIGRCDRLQMVDIVIPVIVERFAFIILQ